MKRATSIRFALAGASCLTLLCGTPAARAAEPTAAEIAVARRLFAEATELENAARWAEAEPKLREALSVKETPGLRYHLGFCLENQGKLVEALVEYDRADEMIRHGAKAPDVQGLLGPAREGVKQRVARLTITFGTPVDGAQVELDGRPLLDALLGQPLPQNPGRHVVVAKAAGRQPFRRELGLDEGEKVDVVIALPELPASKARDTADAPSAAPAAAEQTDGGARPSGSARTYVLVGEAAVAVLGLGAGVFFTLKKGQDQDDIDALKAEIDQASGGASGACTSPQGSVKADCDALAGKVSDRDDHRALATIGFVGAGVGAAAAIGTFLLWRPSQSRQSALRVAPMVGPSAAGLTAVGRF